MQELSKKYKHKEVEAKWQKYWVDNKTFKFDWNDTKKENIFSIDTPPPHVSGVLHMGHVFGYSQMDCIARYQRMKGMNVFYPVGYDDNGLPSEKYVEKKKKIKSKSMERGEFVKICDKEIKDAEGLIRDLFIKAGYSFDWDEEYRTISDMSRRVSQMSFIDLFNKGHLYQKEEPVIWDVIDQTSLAQTEAEDKEFDSQMNYLRFELVDKEGFGHNPPLEGGSKKTGEVKSDSGRGQNLKAQKFYSEETLGRAKELRQNQTDAEGLLWHYISNKQLGGYKFRRQQPIDKYIVDFVCLEKKLIVELDGSQHGEDEAVKYDDERTKFLEGQGYQVLRFWNDDVFKKMFEVLNTVYYALKGDPSPHHPTKLDSATLPQGEGDSALKLVGLAIKGEGDSALNLGGLSQMSKEESQPLEIMTTRPELLPACVAVFYHPDDKAKYEGKEAITPLGVRVPIIADDSVEKDKGTGVMMCCTFGDHADVEKWKKYNLDLRIILDEKGCVADGVCDFKPRWGDYDENFKKYIEGDGTLGRYMGELKGLFVTKARVKILEMLKEDGKLTPREPVKIKHTVKVGERSKYPVEILVKKQWSIKVLNIKEELHAKAREVKWHPEWMEGRIHSWIDGLSWDWCISRQRFFGVPVPVWNVLKIPMEQLDKRTIVADSAELPVDPTNSLPKFMKAISKKRDSGWISAEVIKDTAIKYIVEGKEVKEVYKKGEQYEVYGETDVFDTWMTSSVSPQLSMQGVTEDLRHDKKRFADLKLPFSLRPQGHDIIRTWAFCTLVKAYYHQNEIPWTDIMVNGFCLAEDGTKMSKSIGNVIDPVKVIDEFGTDAVRYWTSNSTLGTDTSFSKDIMKAGQKLVTKLWNCAKFGEMFFDGLIIKPVSIKDDIKYEKIFEQMDLWILSRLGRAVDLATKSFEKFEYSKARDAVEDFFWNDFCDNYLEIAKIRCYGVNGKKYKDGVYESLNEIEQERIVRGEWSGIRTIYHCLNTVLKLFAPFVPHVTEEIFSCLFKDEFNTCGSVHARGTWPKAEEFVRDEEAEKIGEVVVKVVAEVRKYKSDNGLAMNAPLEVLKVMINVSEGLVKFSDDLKNVTGARKIEFGIGEFEVEIE